MGIMFCPLWKKCEDSVINFKSINQTVNYPKGESLDSILFSVCYLFKLDESQYVDWIHFTVNLCEYGRNNLVIPILLLSLGFNGDNPIPVLDEEVYGDVVDEELPYSNYLEVIRNYGMVKPPLRKQRDKFRDFISRTFKTEFKQEERKYPEDFNESRLLLLKVIPKVTLTDEDIVLFDEIMAMVNFIRGRLSSPVNPFNENLPPEVLCPNSNEEEIYNYIFMATPEVKYEFMSRIQHLNCYSSLRQRLDTYVNNNFEEICLKAMDKFEDYNRDFYCPYQISLRASFKTKEEFASYVKDRIKQRLKDVIQDLGFNNLVLSNVLTSTTDKWYMLQSFFIVTEENSYAYVHCPVERGMGKNIYTGTKIPEEETAADITVNIQDHFRIHLGLDLDLDPWPDISEPEELIKVL